MLRNVGHLENFAIRATDGDLGRVKECYFDNEDWTIRYLVVETGGLFQKNRVLISPVFIDEVSWPEKKIRVNLTCQQVRESPDIDTRVPISRHQEVELHRHYKAPVYWAGYGLWGTGMHPEDVFALQRPHRKEEIPAGDIHETSSTELRSTAIVNGYSVLAARGPVGKVSDFIFDERTWAIRYLVVSIGSVIKSRAVLLSPRWAREINWRQKMIFVDMENARIEDAPTYRQEEPVTAQYEERLAEHYDRPASWK